MADPMLALTLGRMFTSHMVLQAEPQVSFQFKYPDISVIFGHMIFTLFCLNVEISLKVDFFSGKDFLLKAVSLLGGSLHHCLAGLRPWLERCNLVFDQKQQLANYLWKVRVEVSCVSGFTTSSSTPSIGEEAGLR